MLRAEERPEGQAGAFSFADLLNYVRSSKLAMVSTLGSDGRPQSALVGIGVTDDLRIIFDAVSTSRSTKI